MFLPSLALLASIATWAIPSAAADLEPPTSLEGAMAALLGRSPSFRVPAVEARKAEAEHLAAAGAFDWGLGATVQGQYALLPTSFGALTTSGYGALVAQASVGARTRENVSFDIVASMPLVSTLSEGRIPDQPLLTSHLTVPLLKLGPSAPPAAEERATAIHASGAAALQQESESRMVARAASDYWRWVAASEQVKLWMQLEALAADQLKDVDLLIEQHARAPSERAAFVAAAENAAANSGQAEQAAFDRQQALWATLGIQAPSAHAHPRGELPPVPPPLDSPAGVAARAHELSLARPVFAYLECEVSAASVRREAARIAQRPDLNLFVEGAAARVATSTNASADAAGYYGMLGLSFSLPIQNRAARGAYGVSSEVEAARLLDLKSQRNAIAASIDALSSALVTLMRTYEARVRATEEYQRAYEGERIKFRAGAATTMDVIVAQQQYMGSRMAILTDQASYAIRLTELLHESGVLNAAVQSRDSATVTRRLLTSIL